MTATMEALLAELTSEVRVNTGSYIKMEATLEGLRMDYGELRELVTSMAQIQANHAERLTASETRMYELQHLHRELANVKAQIKGLEVQVAANAPVRTPWTATTAAIVAVGALLWTLFGK